MDGLFARGKYPQARTAAMDLLGTGKVTGAWSSALFGLEARKAQRQAGTSLETTRSAFSVLLKNLFRVQSIEFFHTPPLDK